MLIPALALAAVALAGGGVLWSRDGSAEPRGHSAPQRTNAATPPMPTSSVPTTSGTDAPGTSPAAQWLRTLRDLDALRGKAFATRDVALLRRVYVTGPLLSADTALLLRMVPPGCELIGARTTYERPQVRVTVGGVAISARARLSPSRLQFPGQTAQPTSGVGPTQLTVRLAGPPSGRRITAQQFG